MNRNCGQTHHAECWRQHGHSACAEREMARLQERYDLAVKKNGEQFYKIERLEIENAKLNNYMQRVKDAVKSFEALDNETSGAALPWECPRCGEIDWPTGEGTGSQCSACRHEEQ